MHLNRTSHIENSLLKLSTAFYTIRKLSSASNTEVLRIVYFANFQSLLEYGIIFWGNSSHVGYTLLLQNRTIRIVVGVTSRSSCRSYFENRTFGLFHVCVFTY